MTTTIGFATLDEALARIDDLTTRLEALAPLAAAAADLERAAAAVAAMSDLAAEAGEVGGLVMRSAIDRLDALERRGYFTFAAGVGTVVDRIVTTFGEEDLRQLGDNVVLILETVKQMTQPEIMLLLQRTARVARAQDEPDGLSLFRLLRELRDPEVKLGLYRALRVLRGLGSGDDEDTDTREETQ